MTDKFKNVRLSSLTAYDPKDSPTIRPMAPADNPFYLVTKKTKYGLSLEDGNHRATAMQKWALLHGVDPSKIIVRIVDVTGKSADQVESVINRLSKKSR